MRNILIIALFLGYCLSANAQSNDMKALPFHQIPDEPDNYSEENIVARMIDGLGYRYYWATKDLRPEDLAYKPSEDSRMVSETLDHLLGLSETILNGVKNQPNIRPADRPERSFEEQRAQTLYYLKEASDYLRSAKAGTIVEAKIIFQRGDRSSEFPFWNMLNGPIADAIYHVGQVVAFRRASGNPLDAGVNVFMGKTRE